jgi:protein O-GlcNAc transferase
MGNALELLGQLDEAVESYARALVSKPDFGEAAGSMGSVMIALGRLDEGLAWERKGFGVIVFDVEQGVLIDGGNMA